MTALAAARSLIIAFSGFLLGLLLAAITIPLAARAAPPQAAPAAAGDPPKTISIVVYGNDPCPKGEGDEIVVCAREPESERYRIPKRFRGKKVQPAPGNSWNNKVRGTEDASRTAAGLPDTCSMVGTGGQSGCFARFNAQAAAERRRQKQERQASPNGVPQE